MISETQKTKRFCKKKDFLYEKTITPLQTKADRDHNQTIIPEKLLH